MTEPVNAALELTWSSGGTGSVIQTSGDFATVLSTKAAPPGTPLSGTTATGALYQIKVRGCRRVSEEPVQYQIEGRFFNLSKDKRQRIVGIRADES